MLPLYLCNSLPVIKNVESFTEFKRSDDIHAEFGLKRELLKGEMGIGLSHPKCCQIGGLSLGPKLNVSRIFRLKNGSLAGTTGS